MSEQHRWIYHSWIVNDPPDDFALPLVADELLQVTLYDEVPEVGTVMWLQFTEIAYVSLRVLLLSSEHIHEEAIYCAGQVLERGMKTILTHHRLTWDTKKGRGHDLPLLASLLQSLYPEFGDPEYVKICERLTIFQTAGRYPDHPVVSWPRSLHLLTFLDGFVVRCRDLIGVPRGAKTAIGDVMTPTTHDNVIMKAARVAITERNRYCEALGAT